jgi:hypothetical protein
MTISKFDRLMRMGREAIHLRQCRAVLDTPPVRATDDGLILFSMIGTRVVLPYLLAVKTLHRQLNRGRIALLDDGTLTKADKALLAIELGDPVIYPIAAVDTGHCPKGGCWERLFTLLGLRAEHYVVQLDSDTVTLGPVPEVAEAIAANRSFTLAGGEEDAETGFLPVSDFVAKVYSGGPEQGHIQALFESQSDQMPGATALRYGRGCAGFAGFSANGGGLEAAKAFSLKAEALTGERWHEWGSEQIASNFLIANEDGATMLPYARYSNYWNKDWDAEMRFIHFVGAWRYANDHYRRATSAAIEMLAG